MEFKELYGKFLDTSEIKNKKIDVAYGPYPDNRFDIYYPEAGMDRCPLIIFFHGGAFFKGDKGRYQLKPALDGLERGFAVASVNYGLTPARPLPAAVDDAIAAVRYIVAHAAELNVASDKIVLWGESCGATLALIAGMAEYKSVQAIIDWYSPMDIRGLRFDRIGNAEMGDPITFLFGDVQTEEELIGRLNPMTYVREGIPPILIEHGLSDELVDPNVSVAFHTKLLEVLAPEEAPIYLKEGFHHGVEEYESPENLNLMFDFIQKHIR